jgi:hypothetical protein
MCGCRLFFLVEWMGLFTENAAFCRCVWPVQPSFFHVFTIYNKVILVLVHFPSRWSLVLSQTLIYQYNPVLRWLPYSSLRGQEISEYTCLLRIQMMSVRSFLTYSWSQCTTLVDLFTTSMYSSQLSFFLFFIICYIHRLHTKQTSVACESSAGLNTFLKARSIFQQLPVMVPGSKKLSTWPNEPWLFAQMGA